VTKKKTCGDFLPSQRTKLNNSSSTAFVDAGQGPHGRFPTVTSPGRLAERCLERGIIWQRPQHKDYTFGAQSFAEEPPPAAAVVAQAQAGFSRSLPAGLGAGLGGAEGLLGVPHDTGGGNVDEEEEGKEGGVFRESIENGHGGAVNGDATIGGNANGKVDDWAQGSFFTKPVDDTDDPPADGSSSLPANILSSGSNTSGPSVLQETQRMQTLTLGRPSSSSSSSSAAAAAATSSSSSRPHTASATEFLHKWRRDNDIYTPDFPQTSTTWKKKGRPTRA
jgi:hypothetical protein